MYGELPVAICWGINSTAFSLVLTIILADSLISGLAMVQKSTEREKQQILNSMQHVMYMDVTDEQMKGLAEDALTEIMVPYKEGREVKEEGVKMYPFYIRKPQQRHQLPILRQRETCRSRKMKSLWTDSFLRLWEKKKKQGQNWKFLLQKGKGKPLWSRHTGSGP